MRIGPVGRRRERRRGLRRRARGPARGGRPRPRPGMPSTTSATCTAQSVRPASPYSRVPSSGSTIHTRSRVEPRRVVLRLLGEDRVVGPVLARGTARIRSLAWPVAFGAGTAGGRCSSTRSSPARRAASAASAWSSTESVAARRRPVSAVSSNCLRGAAQHARVDGLHEHGVDVGATAEELVGVAVEQQQDRGVRRDVRPTLRGGGRVATATPPMLPIWRSSTTRSGSSSSDGVADVLATRDLDHSLVRAHECDAHLVAHPLRVGGHEDRRHHREHASSFAAVIRR